ncbi:MAG: hypothetical protein OER91_00365 [Gammaproteobacteria bacterium]|nr:hypothetical protein [Gammaproteobacteria bacterium]
MKDEEKQKNYELAEKLLSEQNFSAAVIAGGVATLVAAAAYGYIVARFSIVYGFAAAGVGIVIGQAMQIAGRGIEMRFSVVAAVYTIIGCALGNLINVTALLHSPIDTVQNTSVSDLAGRAASEISFVHLVYWFVAVFAAVFFARRALSRADRLALGMYELRD